MVKSSILIYRDYHKPGDKVKGSVILELDSEICANFVKISCICNSGHSVMMGRGGASGQSKILFDESIFPWKAENGVTKLAAGKHSFPFCFRLPDDMPDSFFMRGAGTMFTIYQVRLTIERPWRWNYTDGKRFDVEADAEQKPMFLKRAGSGYF